MGWHRLRDGEVPWGDYGRMLATGMGRRAKDGVVEIERVGHSCHRSLFTACGVGFCGLFWVNVDYGAGL
jgi:hypothetical protein